MPSGPAGLQSGPRRPVGRIGPAYNRAVDYIIALIPSIGTGILFYVVIRAFVNADRNERAALERIEAEAVSKEYSTPPKV